MAKYKIEFSSDAKKGLKLLQKKAPSAIPKLNKLLIEIEEHPRYGTGQCEQLKGYDGNVYSRRITQEHRLIYLVLDETVTVLVVSTFGHNK